VRHYVLTRSIYGPEWTLEENARRLAITRAVTAPLMAAQDCRRWTWVVALNPTDPLIEERRAVFRSAAPAYREILWRPEPSTPQAVAAAAYRGVPWGEAIGPRDTTILQTRLDDDDGFVPEGIRRYQGAIGSRSPLPTMILMMSRGVRVWDGRFAFVRHNRNAMHTLVTAPGSTLGVYDYGHTACRRAAPVFPVGNRIGWLWVRHRDTISGWKMADRPLCDAIRRVFPIDWRALEEAWT
jgi:hypothetical protein